MDPPSVQFLSKFFHPNVYRDGKVCISTLQHPIPEEDRGMVGATLIKGPPPRPVLPWVRRPSRAVKSPCPVALDCP